MRLTIAYPYDRVRNVRAFFGALVLLSLTITITLPFFDRGDTGVGVPVTTVRLQSAVPSESDHQRMSKAFPETVLPPEHCSFTIETIQNQVGINNGSDTDASNSNRKPLPIWVPGYPGSGSELLRDLVQTMTGDPTAAADIYKDVKQRCSTALTCKTHWPAYKYHAPDQYQYQQQLFAPNVVMLLRNPATALASHFNFKWEVEQGFQDHTRQAPQADWIVWRDQRFLRQVGNWKRMILQWHHAGVAGAGGHSHSHSHSHSHLNSYYNVTLHVPYERLVSVGNLSEGPVEAAKLADELRRAGALKVVAATDIPCVWRTVVMDQPRRQRRQGHRYQPSYTVEQQQVMVDMLQDIMRQLPDQVALTEILTEYLYEIQTNLRIDGDGV
jgi:hypothetical protein